WARRSPPRRCRRNARPKTTAATLSSTLSRTKPKKTERTGRL
ncbi:MAG: hypothetical protein AVDCRST_MAG14-2085, partial [uncultured Rubrobacteraceae bacterium]